MVKRIEQAVSTLMEERPGFKEDLDYEIIVKDLTNIFEETLSDNLAILEKAAEIQDQVVDVPTGNVLAIVLVKNRIKITIKQCRNCFVASHSRDGIVIVIFLDRFSVTV